VYNPVVSGKKRKLKRHLTPRQRAFIRHLASGKSQKKAALDAGYSSANPRQSAHQALEQIRKTAPELLARHGLDDDALIDKYLLPLMNATETKFFPYTKRGKRLLLRRDVANWNVRRDGIDMAFKIRGLYVREAENKGPEFSVVILNAANRPDWSKMQRVQEVAPVLPGRGLLPRRA